MVHGDQESKFSYMAYTTVGRMLSINLSVIKTVNPASLYDANYLHAGSGAGALHRAQLNEHSGSIDSMERGTVEWNSGMVEQAINDPVPFYSPSGHAH